MFEGRVESVKRVNLLYDHVERNYHVITKLTVQWRRSTCVRLAQIL